MLSFHNLWDTDSVQKKTVDQIDGLDLSSPVDDFIYADKKTYGFGGLHIYKALINPLRNNILT